MKRINQYCLTQRHKGTKKGLGNSLCSPCLRAFVRALNISFAFLLAGCTSMVQKSGEVLEGSAFAEKTLAVYRSAGTRKEPKIELKELRLKDGNEALEITNSALPGFALRGDRPGAGGSFELRQLRFLSSHVHGWNEFNLDLLGSASLSSSAESSLLLCIADEVERVQISSGKIRLKSSRLTGTAALTPLRNRRERILALTEWMSQNEQTSQTSLLNRVFSDKEEFEDYWKPLLFPELVSKRKRPAAYSACLAADAPPEWGRADSIK